MRTNVFLPLVVLILVSACSGPISAVRVPDNRPAIAIQGAAADAILYVDGLSMGAAQQFDGRTQVLVLEPGPHKVEVISRGKRLLSEQIFLGGEETKTLIISEGGSTP
jgi:hypothetical protein